MSTSHVQKKQTRAPAHPLRQLGIVGYDAVEPVVLAALAERAPLLLIGAHGTAKSLLLNRLAHALGLEHRHYNASLLNFDDLVGYPLPSEDRSGLVYISTPSTVWQAESVFLDEISRCRPDLQNKLFPLIHERVVQGIPLERLQHRWAAMNPPSVDDALDAEEQGYRGSEPLDAALADRFAFVVQVPGLDELSESDQRAVLSGAGDEIDEDAPARLRALVETVRTLIPAISASFTAPVAEYVQVLSGKLAAMQRPISPRRGRQLVRNVIAVHAVRTALDVRDIAVPDSAFTALRCSLPHAASGLGVDVAKLLAAHRAACELVRMDAEDPVRAVLCESDPLQRVALAVRLRLEPLPLSTVVLDTVSALEPWKQRAFATALFPVVAQSLDLTASAYDTLAQWAAPALTLQETQRKLGRGSTAHNRWTTSVEALARLSREEPGYALLHDLTLSLLADAIVFEPHRLIDYWRELVTALWGPETSAPSRAA